MSTATDRPYTVETVTQQAERSSANPAATNVQMRLLVELQLLTFLLYQQGSYSEDIAAMRQDIANSIT